MLFIKAMLTFDDAGTREERWKTNIFAAFRSVFKDLAKRDCLTIDKTLYPTKGGILFKTYNKNMSAKYGPNYRSLQSSRKSYIYYTIPYT